MSQSQADSAAVDPPAEETRQPVPDNEPYPEDDPVDEEDENEDDDEDEEDYRDEDGDKVRRPFLLLLLLTRDLLVILFFS